MATKQVIAELLVAIGVDSKEAQRSAAKLSKSLKKAEGSAKELGTEVDETALKLKRMGKAGELAGKFARTMTAALVGAGTAVAGIGKAVIGTGARFEKLRAQLKTATGSAQGAEKALGFIKDFAQNTPFQVDQITEAFVKLTNLGLTPSSRALTSYGDTASAMGKELDQFVEAAADAVTGEFERLKEFGIKARSEGDRVTFTFRGMATEVGKNSAEIEEFLIGLGESNFGGAMAEQMNTLGGILSNVKDAFTDFLLSISEMGPLEEFKALVGDLRDAAGDKKGLAKTIAKTLVRAIKALRRALSGDFIGAFKKVVEVLDFVVSNFDKLIALLAGAKLASAFIAAAAGFQSMGFAAAGALGPIGLIMGALLALIPVAVEAGGAIGDAIGKGRQRDKDRRAGEIEGEERGSGVTLDASPQHRQRIDAAREAVKDSAVNRGGSAQARKNAKTKADDELRAALRSNRIAIASGAGRARREAGDAEAFGNLVEFGAGLIGSASSGGLDDTLNTFLGAKEEPKKKPKRRGGGGRRKAASKAKPKVTSPTTVSEFFGAAARGELGPIAARTPSTAGIEPTVAVDIVNNNFSFKIDQKISGVLDPKAAGGASAAAIRKEFDARLAVAGQQLGTNLVR